MRVLVAVGVILLSLLTTIGQEAAVTPLTRVRLEQALVQGGSDALRALERETRASGTPVALTEAEWVELAASRWQQGAADEAAALLAWAAHHHPDSRSIHHRLAVARFAVGDEDGALASMGRVHALRREAGLSRFLARSGDGLAKDASEVIERHVQATGGRRAWEEVDTLSLHLRVFGSGERGATGLGGEGAGMERQYRRPGLFRQGFVSSERFVATDGKTVWNVDAGQWTPNGDSAFTRLASLNFGLLEPTAGGARFELVGVDVLNFTPVYHVRRTFEEGVTEELYFAVETGFLVEVRSPYTAGTPFMHSFMSFWDYRDVGGIKLPFVQIRNMGPLGPPHGLVVQSAEVNTELAESRFLPPKK